MVVVVAVDREAARGHTRHRVGPEAVPPTALPATIPDRPHARGRGLVRGLGHDRALCPSRLGSRLVCALCELSVCVRNQRTAQNKFFSSVNRLKLKFIYICVQQIFCRLFRHSYQYICHFFNLQMLGCQTRSRCLSEKWKTCYVTNICIERNSLIGISLKLFTKHNIRYHMSKKSITKGNKTPKEIRCVVQKINNPIVWYCLSHFPSIRCIFLLQIHLISDFQFKSFLLFRLFESYFSGIRLKKR